MPYAKNNTLSCWEDFCRAAGMTDLEIAEAEFYSEIENAIYEKRRKSDEKDDEDLQEQEEG